MDLKGKAFVILGVDDEVAVLKGGEHLYKG
jgi:hypothetical protein